MKWIENQKKNVLDGKVKFRYVIDVNTICINMLM